MTKRVTQVTGPIIMALLMAAIFVACSGSQGGEVEEPSDELTNEASATADPLEEDPTDTSPAEEPDEEVTPRGGAGRLHIKVMAGGEPATAKLRILTADVEPELVAEGSSSQTYDVPAGRYDVEITLDSLLDRPQKRLQAVPVSAGQTTDRDIDVPVGTIKLLPRRGNSVVKSEVRWRYNGGGDWFEGTSQTGEDLTLSCGRYDAEITVNRTKITISDIQVYEGKRTVSPPVQMR